MTRDDTVHLLRLRYQLCGQRFSDETADAWHEVLEHADAARTRQALLALVHGGIDKISLGQICERTFPQGGARTTEPEPSDDEESPVSPERAQWWINEIRRQQAERQAIREANGTCRPTAGT